MPTNGMTIDSLNTVSSLTAQDEVPVWDKEASGEPTRKITAQNMANSVKSLASLPNTTEMNTAIDQSTADVIRTGDVVNSLTSTATNVPLSAAMGKALNDKITTYTAGTTVKCRRVGSVVSLTIGTGVTVGTNGVFYTIDEGFRPVENTYFFVTGSGSANTSYLAVVRTNGDVAVYNRGDSIDYLFGSVTYIK